MEVVCAEPQIMGCLMTIEKRKIIVDPTSITNKLIRMNYIEQAITTLLEAIGEDPSRPGLKDTPKRVAKSFIDDLCSGYEIDPLSLLKTFEDEEYGGIILVRDIPFVSLCEHHLLIFRGVCHVAYIPN